VVERPPGDRPNGSGALGPATSIRVVVEDRGPGIPAAERELLFERFYRGSRSGQRAANTGTGLGLSLVAEHVRLHGGQISVEDNPGRGSRFVVELPLQPNGSSSPNGSEVVEAATDETDT
jgi:signal transduction histidine kinase